MSKYHQPSLAYISNITLNVHDPKKLVDFYTLLGMHIFSQTKDATVLGSAMLQDIAGLNIQFIDCINNPTTMSSPTKMGVGIFFH